MQRMATRADTAESQDAGAGCLIPDFSYRMKNRVDRLMKSKLQAKVCVKAEPGEIQHPDHSAVVHKPARWTDQP